MRSTLALAESASSQNVHVSLEDHHRLKAVVVLKEYNIYSMQNLTVQEAVLGHYVQVAHSGRYPSNLEWIRAQLSLAQLLTSLVGYLEHAWGDEAR